VGQSRTYWGTEGNGYIIERLTIRPLTSEEEASEEEKLSKGKFLCCIKESVGDLDQELINTDDFGGNKKMVSTSDEKDDNAENYSKRFEGHRTRSGRTC
jgi:hypothetical protein